MSVRLDVHRANPIHTHFPFTATTCACWIGWPAVDH